METQKEFEEELKREKYENDALEDLEQQRQEEDEDEITDPYYYYGVNPSSFL